MNGPIQAELYSMALHIALQSSIILGVGLLAIWLARRREAVLRSLIARVALLATVLCAVASPLAASFHLGSVSVPLPAKAARQFAPLLQRMQAAPGAPVAATGRASNTASDKPLAATSTAIPEVIQKAAPVATSVSLTQRIPFTTVIIYLWAIVAIALIVWLWLGQIGVTLLCRRAAVIGDEALNHLNDEISGVLKVRPPRLLASNETRSPFLVCSWRPAIVLPASLAAEFRGDEQRGILCHELAHLRQRDGLWRIGMLSLSALLWFQPLIWILQRQMAQASEEACDDYVLSLGVTDRSYAQCLIGLAERIMPTPSLPATAIGILPRRSSLTRRVLRILNGAQKGLTLSPWARAGAAIFLVGAVWMGSLAITARVLGDSGKQLDIDTSAFTWARQQGFSVAPISLVSEQANTNLNQFPSDLTAQDAEMVHECNAIPGATSQATWSAGTSDNGGQMARDSLTAFVAAHPHFFYSEYLLAEWYLSHDDLADYRVWRARSFADAPAFLAGRIQYKDGRPLAGYTLAITMQCRNTNDSSHPISTLLNYGFLTTDSDGCYYLPVYHGVLNVASEADHNVGDPPFKTLDQLVGPKLAGTEMLSPFMTFAVPVSTAEHEQGIVFDGRVGALPPRFVEPDIELNPPFTSRSPIWYKPMAVRGTKLTVSWKPYPGAEGYDVGLTVLNQGSHPSVFIPFPYNGRKRWVQAGIYPLNVLTRQTSVTFDMDKRVSSKPLYLHSYYPQPPLRFHRGWVYSVQVSCDGSDSRWLASSKYYSFQPTDAANP